MKELYWKAEKTFSTWYNLIIYNVQFTFNQMSFRSNQYDGCIGVILSKQVMRSNAMKLLANHY